MKYDLIFKIYVLGKRLSNTMVIQRLAGVALEVNFGESQYISVWTTLAYKFREDNLRFIQV